MKKSILLLLLCVVAITKVQAQSSFSGYFKEGAYKFDDLFKMQRTSVFPGFKSSFGFSPWNTMMLSQSGTMDAEGGKSDRYRQYCKGILVENGMMNVISKYNVALYVNGLFLPNLNIDTSVQVPDTIALNAALEYIGAAKYAWQDTTMEARIKQIITYPTDTTSDTTIDPTRTWYPTGELVIATPYGDTAYHDTSKYQLCWKFAINPLYLDTFAVDTNTVDTVPHYDTISAFRRHNEVIVYVNAHTGTVHRYDPNLYHWSGTVNTFYEGTHSVDIHDKGSLWWAMRGIYGRFILHDDRRNIEVMVHDGSGYEYTGVSHKADDTWTNKTDMDAYWQLEATADYFQTNHGFWGTQQPPHSYAIPQRIRILASTGTGGGEARASYSYSMKDGTDNYDFAADNSSLGRVSAAQLDITAHEYAHAIIYHGPNLNGYGETGALLEGFCDFFGAISSYRIHSSYTNDWVYGFGHQTGLIARNFVDPTADYPSASSAAYGDTHWPGTQYNASGVFRHQMVLHDWGGSFGGISVAATPPTERDIFVTTYWWTWNTLNYHDYALQELAWHEYHYGKCSPQWISCARAWAAVNVSVGSSSCAGLKRMINPRVVTPSQINTTTARLKVVNVDEGTPLPIAYNWIIPATWTVAYDLDNSGFMITEVADFSSQYVKCAVVNADSTVDTVVGVVHFGTDGAGKAVNNKNTIGNESMTSDDILLYPNPADRQLNIDLPYQPKSALSYKITNIVGKQVYANSLYEKSNLVSLPMLPAGVYIMKIEGDGKQFIKRFVIK